MADALGLVVAMDNPEAVCLEGASHREVLRGVRAGERRCFTLLSTHYWMKAVDYTFRTGLCIQQDG